MCWFKVALYFLPIKKMNYHFQKLQSVRGLLSYFNFKEKLIIRDVIHLCILLSDHNDGFS